MNSRTLLVVLIGLLSFAVVAVGYLLFRYVQNINTPVNESRELTPQREIEKSITQAPIQLESLPYGKDSKMVDTGYVIYNLRAKVNTIKKSASGNYEIELWSLDGSERRVFSIPPKNVFYSSTKQKEISGDEVKPGDDVSITVTYYIEDLSKASVDNFTVLNK